MIGPKTPKAAQGHKEEVWRASEQSTDVVGRPGTTWRPLDGRGDNKSSLRHKSTQGRVSEGTSEDQSPLQSSNRAAVHKEGV